MKPRHPATPSGVVAGTYRHVQTRTGQASQMRYLTSMTPEFNGSTQPSLRPGRSCPLSYRYGTTALDRAPDFSAETLYVIGGLYGNPFALDALLRLGDIEADAQLVFNGDFNWFNRDDASFTRINTEVLRHRALRGNVETELLSSDAAAGCGCGYPGYVSDADVARSNAIMGVLAQTAQRHRALSERLAALPMHLVASVGGRRVGIVHGDAESLAGWAFGEEAIDPARVTAQFAAAQVRVFASSHTCLPLGETFDGLQGACALFNNGAAGMPNFAGTSYGLITRSSTRAAPPRLGALYGTVIDGVHLDCVPLHFDQAAWLEHFDRVWPADSPAALSYRKRITQGPGYLPAQAMRGAVVAPAMAAPALVNPAAAKSAAAVPAYKAVVTAVAV